MLGFEKLAISLFRISGRVPIRERSDKRRGNGGEPTERRRIAPFVGQRSQVIRHQPRNRCPTLTGDLFGLHDEIGVDSKRELGLHAVQYLQFCTARNENRCLQLPSAVNPRLKLAGRRIK